MNLRTALAQGTDLLAAAGVTAPRLTAEVLLGHAVHCGREYFYAHPERELREIEWIHYGRYLHERIKGKPTQYITKVQEFYGREFRVTPAVLIPRPETELLVETLLRTDRPAGPAIDVGTGSGAIAVTLALEGAIDLTAADISRPALKVAAANAERLGASVSFVESDLLQAFADASAAVIVSNPPYVASGDAAEMQREVREWEPHLALFAGPNGLAVYERLIPEARRVLRPGGLLALELGFGQAEAVSALAAGWRDLRTIPDLAGIPRVLVCRKP
jgi:release factor glutamine methyltransferase